MGVGEARFSVFDIERMYRFFDVFDAIGVGLLLIERSQLAACLNP